MRALLGRLWRRWGPTGFRQQVRWATQAVEGRCITKLLEDVDRAMARTPWWAVRMRWQQRRLYAVLQLALKAYVAGVKDAPKAHDVTKRHLAMLGMLRGPRNN